MTKVVPYLSDEADRARCSGAAGRVRASARRRYRTADSHRGYRREAPEARHRVRRYPSPVRCAALRSRPRSRHPWRDFLRRGRIVIDESLDPEENPSKEGRYRFTLAHEGGGHWRLHRHLFANDPAQALLFGGPATPSVVCRSSQAKERVEWQADFYASCLLDATQAGLWPPGTRCSRIASRASFSRASRSTTPSSRSRATDRQIGDFDLLRGRRQCAGPHRPTAGQAFPCFDDRHAHPSGEARAAASRSSAPTDSDRWRVTPFFEEIVKCQLDRSNTRSAARDDRV